MEYGNDVVITCANEVRAELRALTQFSTYEGLLDGAPSHKMNQEMLDRITDGEGGSAVYLVPPVERPGARPYETPDGPAAYLPRWRCEGAFEYGGRELRIVWFQDGWAPPIDPAVVEHLRDLDFLALATENPWW
jgi:hypothetical protein